MMTKIEWTDETWNPIEQPSKASPVWTGKLAFDEKALLAPLRWKKPRMVFVNSMGDLFHEDCPDEWIDRVFAVMALCPQHTFRVLTKRSGRMREYFAPQAEDRVMDLAFDFACSKFGRDEAELYYSFGRYRWPLPNVWLGVSVEDQQRADERIPDLLATPAAVRWISAEPLLGQVDLKSCWMRRMTLCGECPSSDDGTPIDCACADESLDWVVAGGESGKGARPMHPDWARSLRDQCAAADVPFFFKQWGDWASVSEVEGPGRFHLFDDFAASRNVGKKRAGRLLDGVQHDGWPNTGE